MKCPKCGCENIDDYKFCRKCGAPREELDKKSDDDSFKNLKKKVKLDSIKESKPRAKANKKYVLMGIIAIMVVAIVAIGISSLNLGGVQPGNEAIININQEPTSAVSSGGYEYSFSFTLTNAPKDANTYYAKISYYDSKGNIVLTASEDFKYETIEDDNTIDVFVYKTSPKAVNVTKCLIEITNNQGELVTSANFDWIN